MKLVLILLSVIICHEARTQLPEYYVRLVSSEVTISRAGAKPIAVTQNQLVYKNDLLILKKGTEITLVDKDANVLTLSTAGAYKVSEVMKIAKKKKQEGTSAKFFKLAFHELLDPHHDFEKFKKENIAGVAGGGSRGEECGNRIFPVNGLKTSADSLIFRWHKTNPSPGYLLTIYDPTGKELVSSNVKDTMLIINLGRQLQARPGKYFWRVNSEGGECEDEVPIHFEILTKDTEKELVKALMNGMNSESLEMQLEQIDKLEKNAFMDAAFSRFDDLVKANPGNKPLLKTYVSFLLKYGFEKEARRAWK